MTDEPRRTSPLRRAGTGLLAAGILAAGLLALIWAFQRSLIYFPDNSPVPQVDHGLPGGQDLVLVTSDGLELAAWWLPPDTETDLGMAVLYTPGNGGHRAGRAPIATELSQRGLGVLLLDYRGYGQNPGRPDEDGLTLDAEAGLAALADLGYQPGQVLYVGESLGAGVAVQLARQAPPAGMVLRSPFTSLADVGAHHYPVLPVGWLLRDRFEVTGHLTGSEVPTVVIYGDADSVVPAEQSAQVAAAAPNLHAEVVLPGADHNDAVMFGPEVAIAVVNLAGAVAAGDESGS